MVQIVSRQWDFLKWQTWMKCIVWKSYPIPKPLSKGSALVSGSRAETWTWCCGIRVGSSRGDFPGVEVMELLYRAVLMWLSLTPIISHTWSVRWPCTYEGQERTAQRECVSWLCCWWENAGGALVCGAGDREHRSLRKGCWAGANVEGDTAGHG